MGKECSCSEKVAPTPATPGRFVYIENQYFLGGSQCWAEAAQPKGAPADNLVPVELALRCCAKIRAREPFCVYVVVPLHPEGGLGHEQRGGRMRRVACKRAMGQTPTARGGRVLRLRERKGCLKLGAPMVGLRSSPFPSTFLPSIHIPAFTPYTNQPNPISPIPWPPSRRPRQRCATGGAVLVVPDDVHDVQPDR